MVIEWEECQHSWIECPFDTMADGKLNCTQVICEKCKCPGERYDPDNSVYWPCT